MNIFRLILNLLVFWGKKKKLNGILDIATLQSLKNRAEVIENYSQIIIDEAHHMPAVSFEVPLKRFKGKYVLGLSATPRRKDGMEAIMYLQCGNTVHESIRKNTIKHTLKTITTQYDTFLDSFTMMRGEIVEDEVRNKLIVYEVMRHPERKILILSERIEHLNILWHMLDVKGVDAILLYGGLSAKEKRVQFEKTDDASIILSTSSYKGFESKNTLDRCNAQMSISFTLIILKYFTLINIT